MNPKNLDECIEELTKQLSPKDIEDLKNGIITPSSLHHSLGRQMRNTWSLWGESELREWFNNIGIFHPDDMSSIIMDSFVCAIRKEPINLNEQVKFYQDYWKRMESNPKSFNVEEINGKLVIT